jgi:ectoine hydroxylase-related dioxygenase (phytanoyl-CoA dioxygenase family)
MAATAMFPMELKERFARDGFFCIPDFFTPEEVKILQAEVERLKQEGHLRNVATDGDGSTHSSSKRNLQLCPTWPVSETFRALPFAEKVVQAVAELIGEPVRLRLDQIFLKPAQDGAGTNWHQDNAYFRVTDPMRGVAMWIAIHDATIENGTMHMIPGLQREELPHSRDPESDHHIRCYPDESQEVPCLLPAGGVVFFAYGTPHCTKGNRTERDRAGLAYHFYHADYPPQDSAADYPMPYLTGPQAEGGAQEFGADQRGRWERLVSGA